MKIFSSKDSGTIPTEESAKKVGGKAKKHTRSNAVQKQSISEREIREKIAAHVETSNTAKAKILKQNSQKLGAGFMNEAINTNKVTSEIPEEEVENTPRDSVKESHLLMSDVKLNDPKDPNTQEKLKTVLSTGAFNFNPRERETLDKILSGS